jgi:hypothetical protein
VKLEEERGEPGVIPIDVVQGREISGAQRDALAAIDEMSAAVQRMRDLVNKVTKYKRNAWDISMWRLESEMRRRLPGYTTPLQESRNCCLVENDANHHAESVGSQAQ